MRINKIKTKKGSAIAYALSIILMVSIVLSSVVQFIVQRISNAYVNESKEQAFQIAESGVHFYRWYLAHETDGKTALQIRDFWTDTDPYPRGVNEPYEAEYIDPEGGAVGKYRITVTPPDPDSTIVMVQSEGWTYKHPEKKRKIQVRFRRPSWSEYVVLTKDFTRFGNGWVVRGKVMSNTGVHFDGVAYNTVSSGLSTYYDSDTDVLDDKPGVWTGWDDEYNTSENSPVFVAGKMFPVTQKDFTGVSADISMIESETKKPNGTNLNGCNSGGCHFTYQNVGRHIILNNTTFTIKNVTSTFGGANTNRIRNETAGTSYDIPDDGAIYVSGPAWVEGRVNDRRVTIVSGNDTATGVVGDIYIGMNNILYTNKDGRDVIGLIAQGDVETIHDSLNDLEINAAILAQNGMFGQKDYNPHCCSAVCAGLHNNATIYGSIASNQRMALLIGRKQCTSNNLAGFLSRVITYDNNLLYNPPPFFPTGTEYSIDLWEEL